MPNLDPYEIADRSLTELKNSFKAREQTLRSFGLPPKVHNQALARLQEEYNEAKFKATSTRSQLDDIKRGIAAGQIDPILGQKAMLSRVAPRETVEAAFPEAVTPQRGRFTPTEFKSYVEEFKDSASETIKKPWLGVNYADPEELKERYFAERAKYAYDSDMNIPERKAFDLAWDEAVYADKKTTKAWKELKQNDPEILTSRTYDQRLLDIAKKKIRGPVSPLAASLKPSRARTMLQSVSPLGAFAAYRELTGKRKTAERVVAPSPKSKADYDALPSGTQYLHPDGQIKVKP